jgi:hypothetical protein
MKKISVLFLLPLIFISFIPQVNAQVKVGVQTGINVTDLNVDFSQEGFKTATRTRFIAGGILTYDFIPLLTLQFEPAYIQKGATVNFQFVENNLTADIEGTISANYVELPLLLRLTIPSALIKPYLLAGGSVAFKVGDAKIKVDKATVNGVDFIDFVPPEERDQTLQIKNNDYIISFGAGVELPISLISLLVEARYDIGLVNLNNDPTDNSEYKTRGIQIKAGILVGL